MGKEYGRQYVRAMRQKRSWRNTEPAVDAMTSDPVLLNARPRGHDSLR